MKKKKTAIIIAIIIVFALMAGMLFLLGNTLKPQKEPDAEDTPAVQDEPEKTEAGDVNTERSMYEDIGKWIEISGGSPTRQSTAGYYHDIDLQTGENLSEKYQNFYNKFATPEYEVPDVLTYLDSKVYKIPYEDYAELMGITEEDDIGDEHIHGDSVAVTFLGKVPYKATEGGYVFNTQEARDEETNERIYLFDTQWSLESFLEDWERGQAILNGESDTADGAILVNGRYTNGITFLRDGDSYLIPLANVIRQVRDPVIDLTEMVPDSPYAGSDPHVYVQVRRAGDSQIIRVPYTVSEYLGKFMTFKYQFNSAVNGWSDEFHYGQGAACYVDAAELTRYTGWHIYTNGKLMHIITDETDVTNRVHLRNQRDLSIQEQFEIYGYAWLTEDPTAVQSALGLDEEGNPIEEEESSESAETENNNENGGD